MAPHLHWMIACGKRMRRSALALLALTLATAAAAPPLAARLLAGMARTPPTSTPFVQVSYRAVLARPIIVLGTLRWAGGDRLERDIEQPFRQTAKINGGEISLQRGSGEVQHVPLAQAPQVGAMLAGFRALLGGNLTVLQQDFVLTAEGDPAHWVVTLTPRTPALRQQLASMVIDGRAHDARCLTVHAANGDTSITLLGALARRGLQSAAPLQSAVAARCRNDP
ncbi:MAG: outer membrane lipoprotein carrier protein LolA [Rhodanobacteraceae bacterium]|nr:MAG: outer membrane lipoprotein carrier protein LolA [Rhodanobacteraceae bacterium]